MKLGPGHFLAVSASLCILTNHVEAQSPCDEACDEHIGFPTCAVKPSSSLYLTNQTDPIIRSSVACICTDKTYLHEMLTCTVRECASNVTSLNEGLTSFFDVCQTIGGVTLPSLAEFFKEIDVAIPSNLALLSPIDGVTFTATAIPSQTVTTVPYSLRETATRNLSAYPTDIPGNSVRNGIPFGVVATCIFAALIL